MTGDIRIMLSKDAVVDWGETNGVTLHDYVDDVDAAVQKAVAAGLNFSSDLSMPASEVGRSRRRQV